MMPALENRQWKLIARPVNMVKRSDFAFTTTQVEEPGVGEVLLKVLYISLDPAMRGWMSEGKSYIPPVALGEVMRAVGIGEVIATNDAGLAVGDIVSGLTGVQDYVTVKGKRLSKIDPGNGIPLERHLNILGVPGMTAYFGLLEIGRPVAGETVVVSGAAGAVGSLVGQIARIKGCRVIGIAGGEEKCRYIVEELGFDRAIDYKREDIRKVLKEESPKGIDIYFDNVGGEILDILLARIGQKARIVICGAISQYNNLEAVVGPRNYISLLTNRARMEGFVVFDYAARYDEATVALGEWLKEGKIQGREEVVAGLNTYPETLLKLFSGEHMGKLVLKVD